jgi:Hg(II)-responsive transcriptional regulator
MVTETERAEGRVGALRIGEVAARAGVNVQTLRYYERRGLLSEPRRAPSGYRLYSAETIRILWFIKRAQELGFSLEEIDRLLKLRDDRVTSCEDVQALAQQKIEAVEEKIRRLSALQVALEELVRNCERGDRSRECPILEAMEVDADTES